MLAHILLTISTASLSVITSEVRQEQFFQAWQKAQADTRSLVVEFTFPGPFLGWGESKTLKGIFRLRRAPNGAVLARCDMEPEDQGMEREVGLLVGDKAYWLKPDQKSALRFNLAGQNIPEFLGRYYNPFMVLLDKECARKSFRLQVSRQDERYTYLVLTPRNAKVTGRFFSGMSWAGDCSGTIALLNTDSDTIPKDMPSALTWTVRFASQRYDIHKWERNGPKPPPLSEFQVPEEMPGWQVADLSSKGTRMLPIKK